MKKVAFIILIGISLSLFSQIISNPPEYPTKDFILNFLNNNIFFQYQNAIKERNNLYQKMKKIQDEELLPKIQKAKELLTKTDSSISTISNYLGFSSQSHFSKVFKQTEGITVTEYRKKHS